MNTEHAPCGYSLAARLGWARLNLTVRGGEAVAGKLMDEDKSLLPMIPIFFSAPQH